MKELAVSFTCGNLKLEGVLVLPAGQGPFPGVVVCHPHPLYGGSMDNNVTLALCQSLAGGSLAALRFNFRGVGRSQGDFAQGIGEQEDVSAALAWLGGQPGVDRGRLGLAGYSFGASVAIPVAGQHEMVKALALISPPLTEGSPDALRRNSKPKLIMAGGRDSFIPVQDIQRLVEELPEPKEFHAFPGADHFWWGYESELADRAVNFFRRFLGTQAAG